MGALIAKIAFLLPYLQIAFFIAIPVLLLVLVGLFWASKRKKGAAAVDEVTGEPLVEEEGLEGPAAEKRTSFPELEVAQSFAGAVKLLQANVSGRNFRYQIPWFLMLGPSGSGKTTALDHSGLNLPFGRPVRMEHEVKEVCNWWFFEQGIVLDVNGDLVLREDARTSDDDAWKTLLRQLHKYRQERPVDGVILTIPSTDLLDADGRPLDLNEAADRADKIYDKLREAQKILGMRLTVYVLITKCDQVEGYQAFCRELPRRMRDDMFGWSCPYTVDTGYAGDWMPEAVGSVNNELIETQFEMFTGGADTHDAEGLYLFSSRFRNYTGPLKVYFDRLFKESVYHEPFILRGLYFTGDSGEDQDQEKRGRLFFLRDLFEKKVFQEFGLSRPVARYVASKNRSVMFTQAAAVLILIIGILGLWNASGNLRQGHDTLLPVFKSIQGDMGAIRAMRTSKEYDSATFGESTIDLLNGMTQIRTGDFRSIFIPSSWPNRLHNDIVGSLTVAYREFILRTMHGELQRRADESTSAATPATPYGEAPDQSEVIMMAEAPEYQELHRYVMGLGDLEGNIALYNSFADVGAGDLNHLARLVKYLFEVELPPEFYENAAYYKEALARVTTPTIDTRKYRRQAVDTGERMVNRLYERIFDQNPVALYLNALSRNLDSLGTENRTPTENNQLIRDLLAAINGLDNALARSDMASLSNWTMDLGKDFDLMIETAGRINFLGADFAGRVKKQGEVRFPKFKEELLSRSSDLTGPLLFRKKGESRVTLSANVQALREGLEYLMGKPFMAVPPALAEEIAVPPNSRFRWDIDFLSKATGIFDSYEDFRLMGIKKFPKGLQNIMINVARHSLDKNVIHLIAQAARPEGGVLSGGSMRRADVLAEIRNFQDAEPMLTNMLTLFDRLDLVASHQTLSGLIGWQVFTLLDGVDSFLNKEGLYVPWGGDFTWWDGEEKLALTAFDAVDPEDLKNYLDFQRNQVQGLADEYARPLLGFYNNINMLQDRRDSRAYFRWKRILDQLDKYENKQPDNSISSLEKFILKEMDEINLSNYYLKLSGRELGRESGDFFMQIHMDLRDKIYRQCVRLATGKMHREYMVLRDFFNRRLAGRYPFMTEDSRKVYPEADPRDIQEFYRMFDRDAEVARSVLKDQEGAALYGRAAARFLDQMESVRVVFSPFLEDPAKPGAPGDKPAGEAPAEGEAKAGAAPAAAADKKLEYPAIDFECDFRVNRQQEKGGNRIIEWKLVVGDQEFSSIGENKMGRWIFGDPVVLMLRWAKDSPYYPVDAGEDARIDVDTKTVTYEFENNWSMFRMLRTYAAAPSDFRGMSDPKPQTLKLPIYVINEKAEDKEHNKTLSKVFIRVVTYSADKDKNYLMMPNFPVEAPDWN